MADAETAQVDGGVESGEATATVTDNEEVMAVDDQTNDDGEGEPKQTEETGAVSEEAKTEDFVLAGDNTFEAHVIDEAGMDEEGDDDGENEKDNHEGDGEHDDQLMEEDEEEEEEDDSHGHKNQDPNVMPQVNVAVLAQRRWQVKVYPLKPADFTSGNISRVFKHARESLLYLLSPGRNARGKGEMYMSSANQAVKCVQNIMRMEFFHPEINVEIIKKNDDGVIEEKAYLRFDSKLTQILTVQPFRSRQPGRKKDRMIGSVFLKNLPPGTTKDTLRVMFPFAQEINYNPEKFKECTARLVLHYRSHVIPCLKAFAKVELGGNVLELYPLTKRKRAQTDEDNEASDAKHRKTSVEPAKDDRAKKPEEKKAASVEKKDASKDSKPGEAKDRRDDKKEDKKPASQNKPSQNRNRPRNNRFRIQTKGNNNTYRPKLEGGKERSSLSFTAPSPRGNPSTRRGSSNNRSRQDRSPASSTHSFRSDRNSSRDFRHPSSSPRFANNRNTRGSSVRGNRSTRGGSLARSGYSSGGNLSGMGVLSASDASLAVNAEATKEMVLLQNQLSMAIKNQLTMLNQTTMAVEQAKRGLGSSELQQSAGLSRSTPKGIGSGAGPSRRSVDQYRPGNSLDDGGDRYTSRQRARPKPAAAAATAAGGGRRGRGRRGGGGGGNFGNKGGSGGYGNKGGGGGYGSNINKRAIASYKDVQVDDFYRAPASDPYNDPYVSAQDYAYDRNISSFASSSARSAYDQEGDYSEYY